MNCIIEGFDFFNMESMKYWSFPSTWETKKKKKTVNERIFSGEWYGALKRDGAFMLFCKDENNNMYFRPRSRNVKKEFVNKIDWVPHLHDFFEALPKGTCLLGELYLPSKEEAKATTSIMNCLVDKAVKRQEKEKLHYYIFDILAWKGESLINASAIDRFGLLTDIFYNTSDIGPFYGDYKWIEVADYYNGQNLWNKLQEYLADGLEGVVITQQDAPYRPGKRPSKETLKIKKELQETIDCIVIGANPPTKPYEGKEIESWQFWYNEQVEQKIKDYMYKDYAEGAPVIPVTKNWFYGWAGSLKLGLYKGNELIHIGNLSGISDEMKENWKNYVGKVAEIAAMEIMDNAQCGRGIRHPKLVQIRDDKKPKECVYEQIKK